MAENVSVTIIGENEQLPDSFPGSDVGNRQPADGVKEREGTTLGIALGNREPERIAGIPLISPIDIGAGRAPDAPAGDAPRRRGRPPGSRNRTTDPAAGTDTEKTASPVTALGSIEEILLSIHWMGAMLLSAPEFELKPEEARKLSDATQRVAKLYNKAVNPRTLAWLNFGSVAVGIYGPRARAVYDRTTKKAAKVVSIDRPPAPAPQPVKTAAPNPQPQQRTNGQPSPFMNPSQLDATPPFGGDEI